jgi:dihydrofolate reductase
MALKFHISMSLDGYITGPDPRDDVPLGDGGEQLHDWMAGLTDLRRERRSVTGTPDADVIGASYDELGALVMGRAMFDAGYEPWGADPPFGMPVFVVTHRPHEPLPMRGGTTYRFVTEGVEAALEQARGAAGGRDVGVAGGANLAQQYLERGLLDELTIHLVPVLLGGGVRLFGPASRRLEQIRVTPSDGVTHITYR